MKMTTIFKDIHSFEDIQKQKLALEKKLRVTEKSISEKTDLTRILFNNKAGLGRILGEKGGKTELIQNVLPLVINFIQKQIQNNPHMKLIRRVVIYSIFGSVSAFLVYKYLIYRKTGNKK